MTKKSNSATEQEIVEFWESVERSAKAARALPRWMKAGLLVDSTNFVTFASEPSASNKKP